MNRLIGLHKLGYSFPIMLTVQEKRKENGDRQYVGSLIHTDVDSQEGLIIITEDGMIQAISKNVELMFGYKASDILRENVNVLMTDAYATNHDSYLARYRESGEQHVIGTAGRNVPARRKDGTVFPVHLEIEEQYLLGERFFVGHLTDTSTLSAVIYMDGFGIIQNTDANVSKLLGYQKADLAGKNIKGIMPSPYSEYHDGYLERFRRTKITNILRNTEGRNLPAIHADGSVVQLKAIIARSDLGDGGSSGRYLFKGIIKRLDTFSLNTNVRPGFDDHHLIEMKKDGTITAIDPSVLRLLGYNSEKGPEDYIGQSIDTLVPLNPAAGRQMASSWMSQALTNPDLNFYIQLVTKSYTPMPFTFALAMKSTDTIIMRLRDLTSVDAIVTIDEAGTVLSMNEDSALLLGHEPDEVIGRNLKTIMAEELASNHDSYLQRYKETRVKHIIGSSQAIDTIHRDQSVMSVEIQIVDIPTREGLNYIARIRHASLQNKFDKDAIDGLFVDLKGRKDNNELKEEIFVGSTTGSQVLKSQGSIVESNASGSQAGVNHIEGLSDSEEDSDDEEEEEAILAELEELSKKVKNIKTSQAEDPINKKLRIGLNIVAAIYICLLTVAIITFNLLEKPFDLYIFGDEVNIQGTYLNDLIYIARVTYLQTHSDEVLQLLTADYETQDYWPCTWGSKPYTFNRLGPNNVATGVMTTIPTCVFSEKLNATYSMEKYVKELKHAQEWFSVKYPTIRVEGDILDSVYNSPFDYYEFDNGTANPPSTHEVSTWADFIGSKVIDAADKLIKSPNITSGESRLDWQFIIYNRDIMTGRINSLQKAVYGKIEYLMGVELIAHLVFTVATLLSFAAAFYFILYFRIQGIQRDRVSLLKLLLLIPKTTIFEFVSTIYRDQEEEDDDGMEDGKSTASGSRKTDILKRLKKMHSDEVVDVKVDNSYGLYIFFGVGLLSVSLPLVAHVIYRFVFNANYAYELHQYMDVLELFADIHSLLWRSTGLWAIRGYVPTRDMRFWYNMNDTTYRLNAATNEVYSRYYIVQKDFAGDDEFSALLYGVNQLKDVYKSCQDEEKVKVTIRSGSNYTYPAQYAGKQYYEVPKKDFRCNDKYDTTYSTPPELALPYDYSLHTTRGVGLYIRSLLKSAWVVAQTPGYEVNKPLGPIDTPDYWYIIESLPDEGVDAVYALKVLVRDRLLASYSETILAYNVTYIVTLVYVFILFFWVFAKVQEELNAEAQHNRGREFFYFFYFSH